MKFDQIIDKVIDKVNVFEKYFALFKELGSKSRHILIFQFTGIYSKTNCDQSVVFYSFEEDVYQ